MQSCELPISELVFWFSMIYNISIKNKFALLFKIHLPIDEKRIIQDYHNTYFSIDFD